MNIDHEIKRYEEATRAAIEVSAMIEAYNSIREVSAARTSSEGAIDYNPLTNGGMLMSFTTSSKGGRFDMEGATVCIQIFDDGRDPRSIEISVTTKEGGLIFKSIGDFRLEAWPASLGGAELLNTPTEQSA